LNACAGPEGDREWIFEFFGRYTSKNGYPPTGGARARRSSFIPSRPCAPLANTTHSPKLANDVTERSAVRLFETQGLSLEDVILGASADVTAGGTADIPLCGGHMRYAGGCGRDSCGSDLS
jgi:hypothetical protein